jgi:galactokinase
MLELAGETLPPLEIARLGQRVEHHYMNAPTGLLDQLSSLLGRSGQAVRLDFRTLGHAHVPLPDGVTFLAFNSHVAHDLSDEYAHRRATCERAAAALRRDGHPVDTLRDVTPDLLATARGRLSPSQYRRAHHVVHENRRVEEAVVAMTRGDAAALGQLMHESHDSSREYFENSCRELDVLVDLGRELPGHVGARLSGGGFGGITIHAVERTHARQYAAQLCDDFEQVLGRRPTALHAEPGPGAYSNSPPVRPSSR